MSSYPRAAFAEYFGIQLLGAGLRRYEDEHGSFSGDESGAARRHASTRSQPRGCGCSVSGPRLRYTR